MNCILISSLQFQHQFSNRYTVLRTRHLAVGQVEAHDPRREAVQLVVDLGGRRRRRQLVGVGLERHSERASLGWNTTDGGHVRKKKKLVVNLNMSY